MKNDKHISLEDIGNKLPFTTPDNYFEQFAKNFDEQIGIRSNFHKKIIRPWMYMAAMFVGVLIAGQVFYSAHKSNETLNAENYELYIYSQVDEASLMDYYMDVKTIKH